MFAVIFSGGKQYRAKVGDKIQLEASPDEVGAHVTFDKILMISTAGQVAVGQPYLANSSVSGVVLQHGRGKKIHIIKLKRRKHHLKRQGHRQNYTTVQITAIHADGVLSKQEESSEHGN